MKIEANDKEIQDIFSLGYFKIPRFQRPYSWEIDEVESFWNDVVKENPENYFIGSMVVYQAKKPYFGIVDGQQRLTTITLILSVLRNAFLKIGEENLAKGIHKYIEKANIDNEDEYVLKAETSFPYLQSHIQSFEGFKLNCDVGTEELKLKKSYDFLTKKLFESLPELLSYSDEETQHLLFTNHDAELVQQLKAIRDKVLSLKLVFIQLENEEDAYLIFETLNARGKDLTTSDLVKNLLLKKLQNKNIILDKAKESWKTLTKKFDDISDIDVLGSYLLHYWMSQYEYTTDKTLFSKVKLHLKNGDDRANTLITDLNESAEYYCRMLRPDSCRWNKEEREVKRLLESLNIFKVKQQSSFVLSLLRAYYKNKITLKNLKNTLTKIVSFHYCFNAITKQRSSGSIATKYSNLAIKLSNIKQKNDFQDISNELIVFLKNKLPEQNEFEVKFSELHYLSNITKFKSIIRYTLNSMLSECENGLTVDLNNMTIEHIIPQSAIGENNTQEIVASIGNLILTSEQVNAVTLSNKNPNEKLRLLKDLAYPLDKALINKDSWNADNIKIRTKEMATSIYQSLNL
ncbi:DUF262 domain-containing protein [Colwellia sp. MB02u-18]|uniref:DUF262 domain-containing protein n=1 Tax=unclassified Colwellia TaxID=196834 RepID=UPI0015F56CF4|nr:MULTISPECIES: DUF262 domain-containing protein [unclassified Colwellia]MBA6224011.1 DUF262 domain-containing protein [Colwellia sp. MB3u-45]MBA6266526.1 DUF262 domain-containing protein [Colwellia sp. MB3u-43]MBA6320192.1 DUF262 domain-containing protein [Colwellia sp. MB02u-19]MBA6326003.1 DUF262 domain-containing protein [Colwellia sp. MB02u-18]MBA6332646.1 DUF262 domain-containing protein [Colwellia sp. MB02u-12]